LVQQLSCIGAEIRWTNRVRVSTSARRLARAPDGFSAHLAAIAHAGSGAGTAQVG
jgi:hypothetical protein